MLRVGLTGGLGSGKSTVGTILARLGAYVLQADEIGRDLMQPGEAVYAAIVERFGPGVMRADASLDRTELARLAFAEGRVEDLNAIVHPAVIGRQAEMTAEIEARDPGAVVVVESALIFETRYGGGWRERFDRLVLVAANDETKVQRYLVRTAARRVPGEGSGDPEADARRRLASQMPDEEKAPHCDYVLWNDGSLQGLEDQVSVLWESLRQDAQAKMAREDQG